jgi:hypothetical protein
MKRVSIILAVSLLLCGCSLHDDFKYSSKRELIAVNGFLHPDSTVTIRVTRTAPYPNGDSFVAVKKATVRLYENDTLLGELAYDASLAAYSLDYRPKESYVYRLVVYPEGQDSLTASTSIPRNSVAETCYSPFPETEDILLKGKANLNTHIRRIDLSAVVWLGITSTHFRFYRPDPESYRVVVDSSTTETDVVGSLYSSSPYIDPFNGYRDEGLNGYNWYLRLSPARNLEEYQFYVFSRETNLFYSYATLQRLSGPRGLYVHVYTASEEYDHYLKNAIVNYLNSNLEADIPNPFAEQVVNYSNVKGGTGVFAGYASTTIPVHTFKCP